LRYFGELTEALKSLPLWATSTANLTASISDAKASLKRSNDLTNLSPKPSFPATFVARSVATNRSPFTFNAVGLSVAKRVCDYCGFRVEAARLKNGIIAKCPKCNGVATIAQGKREDGSVFFAFACNRCNWVADDHWTMAAFVLLPH